jgi:hypothetical protein
MENAAVASKTSLRFFMSILGVGAVRKSTTYLRVMRHALNGLTTVRQECGGVYRRSDYFAGSELSHLAI